MEQIYNPTWQWMEDQFDNPNATCTSGIAANVTPGADLTGVVLNVGNVIVGDTFFEPATAQHFEVKAVTAGGTGGASTTCTMIKVPSAATTVVAANANFVRMGNFMVEGGYYPTAIGQRPKFLSNNVQLVTRSISITNTMQQVATYHGSQWEYDKRAAISKFRGDMERVCLWGAQYSESRTQTVGGKAATGTQRGSRGILTSITTNSTSYGTFTEDALETHLANKVWGNRNAGSMQKLAVSGKNILKGINTIAKDKWRLLDKASSEYGLDITVYMTFGGRKLYLIEEREFYNNTSGTFSYDDVMVTLDPQYISLKRLGGSLMQVIGTKDPTKDEQSVVLRAEFGIETRCEQFHSIFKK